MWGDIKISANKYFEWQFEGPAFTKNSNTKFECALHWNEKQDHAGLSFTLTIKGMFYFGLTIYDHRHWDSNKNDWISNDAPMIAQWTPKNKKDFNEMDS